MNKRPMLAVACFLAGCGGGGGGQPTAAAPTANIPSVTSDYSVSLPLVSHADASTYKILLMGNSHASGLQSTLQRLLTLGQPDKIIDVQISPHSGFLADRVNDGVSEEKLESARWTHVILQAQKYSSSGTLTYPTTAAEYWIRGSKEIGATPILFPEHPRKDNTWEGQTLWDLHSGIAVRENACVAPVGLVWDEVIFRDPSLTLHQADGNHAAATGLLLTALVFYQIITEQAVESLPELSEFGIGPATEQLMKESVSALLFVYPPCAYED